MTIQSSDDNTLGNKVVQDRGCNIWTLLYDLFKPGQPIREYHEHKRNQANTANADSVEVPTLK